MVLSAHSFLSHLHFFRVDEIRVSKYGHLMLPETFPDKVTADNVFTHETVVHCLFTVVKIPL